MSDAPHLSLVPAPAAESPNGALETIRSRGATIGLRFRSCPAPDLHPGLTHARRADGTHRFAVRIGDEAIVADADLAEAEGVRIAEILGWSVEDLLRRTSDERTINDFCDKLAEAYEETYGLFRALRLLASSEKPEAMVRSLCGDIQRTLPFRWVAVQFGAAAHVAPTLRARLIMAGAFPGDLARLEALSGERVAAMRGDSWTKVLEPARDPLAALAHGDVVCEPVTHDDSVIGMMLAGGKTGPDATVAGPEIQFLDATADFLGTFHENIARFDEQQAMMRSTLEALVAAIDAKDRYTCGHSQRVAVVAEAIARELGMADAEVERVRLAGLVHDVGKIGVPEEILRKPGTPTEREFAAIRQHPEIGHRILDGIVGFEDLLPGVLHHHERWDGRGYPHRLAGEAIPLMARIIGIADAFDAMSSNRSYRSALPRERVLAEIQRGAGSQFDPHVARAFDRVGLDEYDRLLERQAREATSARRAA